MKIDPDWESKIKIVADCLIVDPDEEDVVRKAYVILGESPVNATRKIDTLVIDKVLSASVINKETGEVIIHIDNERVGDYVLGNTD